MSNIDVEKHRTWKKITMTLLLTNGCLSILSSNHFATDFVTPLINIRKKGDLTLICLGCRPVRRNTKLYLKVDKFVWKLNFFTQSKLFNYMQCAFFLKYPKTIRGRKISPTLRWSSSHR